MRECELYKHIVFETDTDAWLFVGPYRGRADQMAIISRGFTGRRSPSNVDLPPVRKPD